jgi:GNAT superfamily N-acetyltransferase
MKAIVGSGKVPGILAYHRGRAVGWCSVAPRKEFRRLERSRVLRPVDDRAVWSVVCFFVAKAYRGSGVAARLLRAAVEYVRDRGGQIVEGYAVEPNGETADLAHHGPALCSGVGFAEVARHQRQDPSCGGSLPRIPVRKKMETENGDRGICCPEHFGN